MKKSDIAGRVADRIGLSESAAGNAVAAVFDAVGEALANGEEVRIAGFGSFTTRSRRPVQGATRGQVRVWRYRRRRCRRSSRARYLRLP